MIEVNAKYQTGEFDLLFDSGKIYMGLVDTKPESKDLGDIKETGTTDTGGVTF